MEKVVFDTRVLDTKPLIGEEQNWDEFYPDAREEIPHDMPPPKSRPVHITAYVDADHAHDLVTRRSVTGILIYLNSTPIRSICKRQTRVETSTYGAELVAARMAVEAIMELRYQLRMMGVEIAGPAILYGDNMSVVLNTSVPSSVLKKKMLALSYHRVREAGAARIILFLFTPSGLNKADFITKELGGTPYHNLVKGVMFRNP